MVLFYFWKIVFVILVKNVFVEYDLVWGNIFVNENKWVKNI